MSDVFYKARGHQNVIDASISLCICGGFIGEAMLVAVSVGEFALFHDPSHFIGIFAYDFIKITHENNIMILFGERFDQG